MDSRPVLILVGGPPSTGKTTLAQVLAERMGLVHLSRDSVKSAIAATEATVGADGAVIIEQAKSAMVGEYGQRAFTVTYSVAERLLTQGVSLVMDQAWRRGHAEQHLRPLIDLSRSILILVLVPPAVARERTLRRGERPGLASIHETLEYLEADWDSCVDLDLSLPRLIVENSDGFRPTPEEIERWVWDSLS